MSCPPLVSAAPLSNIVKLIAVGHRAADEDGTRVRFLVLEYLSQGTLAAGIQSGVRLGLPKGFSGLACSAKK